MCVQIMNSALFHKGTFLRFFFNLYSLSFLKFLRQQETTRVLLSAGVYFHLKP
jgi:hypothetical protein